MESNKYFTTGEDILRELTKQMYDSDAESDDELLLDASDSEDSILPNDDDMGDVFDAEDTDIPSLQEDHQEHICQRNFEIGKDDETIWTDKPLVSRFAKVPSKNLISHLPGPRGAAVGDENAHKLFSLFITDDMIESIATFTNCEIDILRASYNNVEGYMNHTDVMEMKALFSLLFMSAVLKNSCLTTNDMFSPVFGPPLFRCGMSRNRFKFLLRALHFDEKSTRPARQVNDKFAPFRDIWNKFEENCQRYYTPSEYVTVDETLVSFRGKCPFKMFIPSKPDKYGLKIISLCDAKTFYFLKGIPYVGKEVVRRKGDLTLPTQYVLRLTEPIAGSNRNVTVDNWFTSIELAEELAKKKLTVVGTLRKNKPQIPPSMISAKTPVLHTRYLYQPDKMILSHTPKKNKKVLLLSSMHSTGEMGENKPDIIEFYNMTKGGVDVMDKLCHDKTTKRTTRRWPLRYFFGILDIAAVNSFILYKFNLNLERYTNEARSDFLKMLAFDLMKPWMTQRADNIHIPKELRFSMKSLLGIPEVEDSPAPATGTSRRRCAFCVRGKDRKGNSKCVKCDQQLCGEHKKVFCPQCASVLVD